jgi:hypothetical protein
MTSSDMNKLALIYGEIERRLERGESSSPELERLFDEVSELTGTEVWVNRNPTWTSSAGRSGRPSESPSSGIG